MSLADADSPLAQRADMRLVPGGTFGMVGQALLRRDVGFIVSRTPVATGRPRAMRSRPIRP
jgi:hypothetical protein